MDDQLKQHLTSRNVWMRGVYMLLLAIAWAVARILLSLTVIFQFFTVLITGTANATLLRFGHNLGLYVLEIIAFFTFNSEHRPFPFADWPDEDPGDNPWLHGEPASPPDVSPSEAGRQKADHSKESAGPVPPSPEREAEPESEPEPTESREPTSDSDDVTKTDPESGRT